MKVGCVVGRFQTPYLHEGHRAILDYAQNENDQLTVLIGTRNTQPDRKNPLDYQTRAAMVREAYPNAFIAAIYDVESNEAWSADVDSFFEGFRHEDVQLYGSRDSFIKDYCGQYTCIKVSELHNVCATDCRNMIEVSSDENSQGTEFFRRGAIYAVNRFYPMSLQTVDVAMYNENSVLLGRKAREKGWRFPGGFVDPSDVSLEAAAIREWREETGYSIADVKQLHYIGSYRVQDFRYRNSEHQIMTALFSVYSHATSFKASDDLTEVARFDYHNLPSIVTCHEPLIDAFMRWREQ